MKMAIVCNGQASVCPRYIAPKFRGSKDERTGRPRDLFEFKDVLPKEMKISVRGGVFDLIWKDLRQSRAGEKE